MERFSFVDCHSHVIPSGDDGAQSIEEGLSLCREAARCGTRILFATPHVWPHVPLTDKRMRAIRAAYDEMRPQAGLELRLGFELTPMHALLQDDPARYELAGTGHVLMEVPFTGTAELVFALGEHVVSAGLTPLIAHPERTEAVLDEPALAGAFAERGWPLQVNATSLLGRHGSAVESLAWSLIEDGTATIVASDGHRSTRPARLDTAYKAVARRVGEGAAALFDGSVLGLASPKRESFPAESKAV
ncbi:MAG TPA: CpsB/CapC family capsule biosynthesis tyrosine phosphatase [Gaiellaceae bacterium]